jgi:hypothetical protein
MIASHLASIARPLDAVRSQARGAAWLLVGLLALVNASACDKVPLTAPTGSTLTLFSNTTVVPLNGSAEITATVIESAGTAAQNGTLVTFTTTIGTIDPTEARTHDGKATVKLLSGGRSGTASVRAFSGGTTSGELTLVVGAAAVKTITLTANPGAVSATRGGSAVLTASVFDENGNPVPGVPVNFTATAGQLLNTQVLTDDSGIARTSLTTSLQAVVTATAGAVTSSNVTIAVNNAPRVSITPPSTLTVNTQGSFSYTITTDTNVGIRSGLINWGDGTSQAVSTSGTTSKAYSSAGSYTVTISATDVNGETGTGQTTVFVTGAGLVGTLAASPNPTTTSVITTMTVTLASTAQAGNIQTVTFDFGDGESTTTAGLITTHRYVRGGTWTAKATLNYVNGTTSAPILTTVIVN